VKGPWDIRGGVDDYLGNVDLKGKRVLEVGTASGFLCYTMEGRGADVVAYDLSDKQSWDVVPYAQYDHAAFDSERRQVFRAGQEVHLSRKAFDLLGILIASQPRVVSKSELLERLWPATFVVEGNLSNLVAEVRSALQDDAQNPRFVRTAHGLGYAFCGPASAALSS